MKVLIPVAGTGTRLRPLTNTQPKPLIPIAGKPILSFIIDELISQGANEFIFVIGYLGDKITKFIETTYPDIQAEFVVQKDRKGLGHAIATCTELIKGQDLLIVLGDTLADFSLTDFITGKRNFIGLKKVDKPALFGVAEVNEHYHIQSVEEKPNLPISNHAIVGVYYFYNTNELVEHLPQYVESQMDSEDEIHFTGFLQYSLEQGNSYYAYMIENWLDCGKKTALLDANERLLNNIGVSESGPTENCVIKPPVYIHRNARIKNSIIGPHVSIGEGVSIENSNLQDCIIGENSQINDIYLERSVVGSESVISGQHYSLNVGDNTEINLNINGKQHE